MSHEAVLIENDGYTETEHATCGEYACTAAVLRHLGVPGKVIEQERAMLSNFPLGDRVFVSVTLLGESDSDEWCAAPECRKFLRHGLNCGCEQDEWCDQPDRDPLTGVSPF
jgi:hypothetical protein